MASIQGTCITCRVAFRDLDIQRDHYKSDWHRYNLKRKVAELEPVTAEEFDERLSHQVALKGPENEGDIQISCNYCKKFFTSKHSYENHLKSKKHQEAVLRYEESGKKLADLGSGCTVRKVTPKMNTKTSVDEEEDDEGWESVDDDQELTADDCVFCSFKSSSVVDNVKHMTDCHSFFIPDIEYLVNLEGLITYLAEKVSCGNMCLWCNEKGKHFHTSKSVQQHMMDKGHCKILYESETLFEFADFYDYSSSYPDNETAVTDEEVGIDVLKDDGFELVLPSGAKIGHRSLMRYYRQNVPPTRLQRAAKVPAVLAYYRALGWKQTPGEVAARHARDISYMQMIRSKRHMQQGMRNNKLQRHIHTQLKW